MLFYDYYAVIYILLVATHSNLPILLASPSSTKFGMYKILIYRMLD